MQITRSHLIGGRVPEAAAGLVSLALERGHVVQGGLQSLGRTNRDAYTIRIHGSACDAVISWARSKETSTFSLSYVMIWQPQNKAWATLPDTSEITGILEATEVQPVEVQEGETELAVPAARTCARPKVRGVRDVHLPA